MKSLAYKLAQKVLEVYWWIFRPKTYGVKVALVDDRGIWLVQNSYYSKKKWNLPGGGYRPKKETALIAASRELKEELSCEGDPELHFVCSYLHTAEFKKDEVSIFEGKVTGTVSSAGVEVSKVQYFRYDELKDLYISRSLEKYLVHKGIGYGDIRYPELHKNQKKP